MLSTIAATHTKSLIAAHQGHISSLIGGYHVAFLAGAAAISAGLVLALVLLRPRSARPDLQLAQAPDETDTFITHELESEAA